MHLGQVEQALRPRAYPRRMAPQFKYRRNLPHIRRDGATYHVSWSLARREEALSPVERDIVITALRHFDSVRYQLHTAVVMDDHVHTLFTPYAAHPLHTIMHSWKSFTAHTLVKLGRIAPVWTAEYFDTIIRDADHLRTTTAYILDNPARRWPGTSSYRWLLMPRPSGPPSLP